MGRQRLWAVVGLVLTAGTGCTAVYSRIKVVGAESAVEAARRANAEKRRPHAYTSATLYLAKALEEESEGHHGAASSLAGKAEELAHESMDGLADAGAGKGE